MRELEYLNQYYGGYHEDGRLTSLHGQVEYLTTLRYIKKYLKHNDRILEIGAGTGRYSHTLAQMGYEVDALDLSSFSNQTYDIVLLLGPMYHLYTKEDKLKALSEALRVTKTNGLLFTAYCIADASIICYGFQGGRVFELIEKNMLDPVTFKAHSTLADVFELCRKEDIDDLKLYRRNG